jgi:predicted nucleic acid-binding Zn ribbon protein
VIQAKVKQKKCKACGKEYTQYSSTQKACSIKCAIALVQESDRKKTARRNRKALKEYNRRDLKWQHKQTQPAFNKLRRLQEFKWFKDRGLEPSCISCGKPIGNDQWCNGHYKTVGSNGRLRYDPLNSYLQHNRSCNMGRSGDIGNYEKGLVKRFGKDEGKKIMDYCQSQNAPKKWTWQELEDMRSGFNVEIKALEVELS